MCSQKKHLHFCDPRTQRKARLVSRGSREMAEERSANRWRRRSQATASTEAAAAAGLPSTTSARHISHKDKRLIRHDSTCNPVLVHMNFIQVPLFPAIWQDYKIQKQRIRKDRTIKLISSGSIGYVQVWTYLVWSGSYPDIRNNKSTGSTKLCHNAVTKSFEHKRSREMTRFKVSFIFLASLTPKNRPQ